MGGAIGLIVHAPSSRRGNAQVQVEMGGLIVIAKLSDLRRARQSHRTQHAFRKQKRGRAVSSGSPIALPSSAKSSTGSQTLLVALSPLVTRHSRCSQDKSAISNFEDNFTYLICVENFVNVTHANTSHEGKVTYPADFDTYVLGKAVIPSRLQSILRLESKLVLTRLMSEGSEQILPSCMWSRSCQRNRPQG